VIAPENAATGRLRVLIITRNLPPMRGGMERLNRHIALELAREFDVAIVGPSGSRSHLPDSIAVEEVPGKPLLRFFLGALRGGVTGARRTKPHLVLAGSGLVAPFAWLAAKVAGGRFAVYVHGLDLIVNSWIYRRFWLPFLARADLCVANSHHTAGLAAATGVPQSRLVVIHPGVELPTQEGDANGFRVRFGLGERPLLLSVGRLIERKGLLQFVERALPDIVARRRDACLIVIGDEAPDLLTADRHNLAARIREAAARLGLSGNLRFLGPQDDGTLCDAFRAANVHVFPVREVAGDVEGFGMVAIEAAAHGLPTVAFAVGGVPDAVESGTSGVLLKPEDYGAMARSVLEMFDRPYDSGSQGAARAFSEQFSWVCFGRTLRQAFQRCISVGRSAV
jgi:phosphatidylinositol alpha-1,6-mannosyltransferase